MDKLLITGGTGSLGQAIAKQALADVCRWRQTIIFSRNEFDQYEMEKVFFTNEYPVTYLLGDVRDRDALSYALRDVTHVIHAAALKHVRKCEENPEEAVSINVDGARNLILTSIGRGVRSVLSVSSDKAVNPINLYGTTKLTADKLFVAANRHSGTRFSVIRPGNFADSRGSVTPFFTKLRDEGATELPIHDKRMTRFHITLQQAAYLCLDAVKHAATGWIFAPKMPSYRLVDLARSIHPKAKLVEVGADPGEKIHEDLVIAMNGVTIQNLDFYITLPRDECPGVVGRVTEDVRSDTNSRWLFRKGKEAKP